MLFIGITDLRRVEVPVYSCLCLVGNSWRKILANQEIVSQAFIFRKNHITVGASIGIALYPVNGKDIEKLIKQADEAMYKIKKSGKNGYAFVTPEK
ncbi:MAG: diguanylate cyclase [Methylococcales bacterium]|nr:diguanylate cyclase [Methylococcales bacterium]